MELTRSGKALVVTLLFCLLFGGYVVGMDQYRFDDVGSALTVLLIYLLLAIFAARWLAGKRSGLIGVMTLEAVFIVLQTVFLIATLGQVLDAGVHNPVDNWWAALLQFLFAVLALTFSTRVYRETRLGVRAAGERR
jgi:hypothetical protein